MTQTNPQPILCTGFHRSGTSLTAQILQKAGVNLGNNLMGGGFSNPDGHFEDLDIVRIHDKLLKQHQLTWQATQAYPSSQEDINTAQTAINKYTQQRIAEIKQSNSSQQSSQISSNSLFNPTSNRYWGVKDPRLSLFLPRWHQSLAGKEIFVLPVRHWTECVQSLHNRHAKNLAYEVFPNTVAEIHLSFWTDPLLASKMWLNYNREILNFVKQHPDNCFILPHHQLMKGYDFISAINEKFAVNLSAVDYASIIKLNYNTASEILPMVTDSLPDSLLAELDDLYHELMSYADNHRNDETTPTIKQKVLDQALWQSAQTLVKNQSKAQVDNDVTAVATTDVDKLDFAQAIELVKSSNIINRSQDFDYLLALTGRIIKLRPHFWQGHEWRGRVHLRMGEYGKAHNHVKNAIVFNANPPPYLHHLLSQITMHNEQFGLALHYIAVAIQKNPNNPAFYLQKANVLTQLNRQPAVTETLSQASEKFPKNLQIQLRNLNILYQDEPQQAIKQAQTAWQQEDGDFCQNAKLGNWLSDRLIEQDNKGVQAKAIKQQIMQNKMQNNDLEIWLNQIIVKIDDNKQAEYLVYLILQAWQKFE